MGGVDKRIVAAGKDAIRNELERLFPLVCEGGYIPSIDHSVSSDISWDSFRYYMETPRSRQRDPASHTNTTRHRTVSCAAPKPAPNTRPSG